MPEPELTGGEVVVVVVVGAGAGLAVVVVVVVDVLVAAVGLDPPTGGGATVVVVVVEFEEGAGVEDAPSLAACWEVPTAVGGVVPGATAASTEAAEANGAPAADATVVGGTNRSVATNLAPDWAPPRSVVMPPDSPGSANAVSTTTIKPRELNVAE
jgi:hypothetical protein